MRATRSLTRTACALATAVMAAACGSSSPNGGTSAGPEGGTAPGSDSGTGLQSDAGASPDGDPGPAPDAAGDAPPALDGTASGDGSVGTFPCGTAPQGAAPPLSVPTGGKTYYVSPSGKDSNDGLSTTTAFQSLQQGATTAQAGDTVLVMDGTYTNTGTNDVVDIEHSGTATAWIVFAAAPGAHPLVTFNGWSAFNITGSYVAVDGFEIQGDRTAITMAQAQSYQTGGQYPASANGSGIIAGSFSLNKGPNHIIIR